MRRVYGKGNRGKCGKIFPCLATKRNILVEMFRVLKILYIQQEIISEYENFVRFISTKLVVVVVTLI